MIARTQKNRGRKIEADIFWEIFSTFRHRPTLSSQLPKARDNADD